MVLAGTRIVRGLNAPPTTDGSALYTDAYGPATPPLPGSVAVVLFPFPTATPDVDLVAPVVEVARGRRCRVDPGGRGRAARARAVGSRPDGRGAGGYHDDRTPVASSGMARRVWRRSAVGRSSCGTAPRSTARGRSSRRSQLGPRAPRSAVGQLADGRILLVAVDGRQPGYSIGLTSFELAQALVRLGAVTGMGLDSGGSTTMAFDGTLLNRPSDGRERSISTGVMLLYRGVFAPEPPALVSPNGDGVAESPELGYRLVRPSSVTVTLRAPGGAPPVGSSALAPPWARIPSPFPRRWRRDGAGPSGVLR